MEDLKTVFTHTVLPAGVAAALMGLAVIVGQLVSKAEQLSVISY